MGYPMTYQRIINRNRLGDGSYEAPPSEWVLGTGRVASDLTDEQKAQLLDHVFEEWGKQVNRLNGQIRMLAGDLRRLESDVVDENAICQYIAQRTGIEPETVAAVLKEFIAW